MRFVSRPVAGSSVLCSRIVLKAYKAVGESTEVPLIYYENNVSATIKLLQVMNEFDCTRIVYSSSATVYGTPPHIPIPESTRIQAESPYGKTKVMCETIMEDLCSGEPCHPASADLTRDQYSFSCARMLS